MTERATNLTESDERHLKAAQGWLELGLIIDAFNELEMLPAEHRRHPDVFKLRYRIYATAGKWSQAFQIAEGLTRLLPDTAEPFIWRSECARKIPDAGPRRALELLLDVVNEFPDEPVVPFNLARYNALLGDRMVARSWLHIAFDIAARKGTSSHWRMQALDEPDLEPLRRG
jgi:hypothetical protein